MYPFEKFGCFQIFKCTVKLCLINPLLYLGSETSPHVISYLTRTSLCSNPLGKIQLLIRSVRVLGIFSYVFKDSSRKSILPLFLYVINKLFWGWLIYFANEVSTALLWQALITYVCIVTRYLRNFLLFVIESSRATFSHHDLAV